MAADAYLPVQSEPAAGGAAPQRRRSRRPFEISSLLSMLAASGFAATFIAIASEVVEGDTRSFDEWVLTALRQPGDLSKPIGPAWLEQVMVDFTSLGGTAVLTLMTTLVATYLFLSDRHRAAWLVVAAVTGGSVISTVLKFGYARPRPELVGHLTSFSSFSFPSGHSLVGTVAYLTLGALVSSVEPRPKVRTFVLGAAILVTLLIGLSRVYTGVHYPTDVLAGWSIGATWALLCLGVARATEGNES
ncbi:MAG: acid phosphatase [Leifsonia xyli]|nr:MAG: acid phosphatase [Leifsonia xyli]